MNGPPGGDISPERRRSGFDRGAWLYWLQQATTLVYLIAGAYLIYRHFRHLHRRIVLLAGILFVLYSVYRFFMVRRSTRR